MELSLKQSPSMDTNQDPMQAQLALQQRQLEQQQALEKADLSKVQGQIENKVGNKLDQHSPEDQKILKKALAKEAVRVGGEDARIGGIGVYPETGKIVAQVGEFHHAYVDPKSTLEAAKLTPPEASKTLEPERERSPALDKTPERDNSEVLAKIDAKVEHKLDAYSPEEQQVLKQALAAEMVKIGGENAPISRMGVTDDGKIAVSNERHTAVIDARATLETAQKEQANLVREQAAQELAQQNPEQAALEKHLDERYDHYMAPIQDEMKALNAVRNDYENFAALPEAEQTALNDRMNELSSQRSALGDVYDLPLQEQADYYAQRDQSESTPPIADLSPEIHPEHQSILETQPLPPETVLPSEQSETPPIPEATISAEDLQRYADQGIEPVLESPPLDVPPLAPEDMTVSDAEMARLNADLNTISAEGAAVNADNTEAQAASETKEFTEINQTIDQMNDSSQKSTWESTKEFTGKAATAVLETNVGGVELAMTAVTGFGAKIASGMASPFFLADGLDAAVAVQKSIEADLTYKPSATTQAAIEPIIKPIEAGYRSVEKSMEHKIGVGLTQTILGSVEALIDLSIGKGLKPAVIAERISATLENTAETINTLFKEMKAAESTAKSAESMSKSTAQLLEKSTASPDDLSRYLSKIDENAAKAYHETGKWPEDVQVPKSPDVLTPDGRIDWAQVPQEGFTLNKDGNAIMKPHKLEIGEVIDRYGPDNGRFTSPVKNSNPYDYDQRSLPYMEDPKMYHQYKVVGELDKLEDYVSRLPDGQLKDDILLNINKYYGGDYSRVITQSGEAASGFNSIGGAVQYRLPLSVDWLEKLNILKEIK